MLVFNPCCWITESHWDSCQWSDGYRLDGKDSISSKKRDLSSCHPMSKI